MSVSHLFNLNATSLLKCSANQICATLCSKHICSKTKSNNSYSIYSRFYFKTCHTDFTVTLKDAITLSIFESNNSLN